MAGRPAGPPHPRPAAVPDAQYRDPGSPFVSLSSTTPRLPRAAETAPTRLGALLFAAKVWAHRARRLLRDLRDGPPRLGKVPADGFDVAAGVSRTDLWSDRLAAERGLQLGKVQNLRRAAAALDGVLIPRGAVFSFWRQVGRASTRRGYVAGRMLQQGCMVPAVGGGLCQLSNALYDAALQAGCIVVERHAHSRVVPGSQAALGRDATVAWNYVDLRFTAPRDLRLTVRLDRDTLQVRLAATSSSALPPPPTDRPAPDATRQPVHDDTVGSCDTCSQVDCFRHLAATAAPSDRTAFLLDGVTPEFTAYIQAARHPGAMLAIPIDGRRWHLARYAWPVAGFGTVRQAPIKTLQRSLQSRRLASHGAARQQASLHHAERLALALARHLPPDVTELCIAQPLLPFLWRNGDLGGRRITVLMNRLPMDLLQARLDEAAQLHPASPTLADFRAPPALLRAEREALDYAAHIVTPHAGIAALFPDRATLLPWHRPLHEAPQPTNDVAFIGPTLGRKGAYEMRDAVRALRLNPVVPAVDLEAADFWSGIDVHRGAPLEARIVVQPAYVEENPRALLAALAAGRRAIATPACGLPPQPGLTLIPAGDGAALIEALRAALS